MQGIKKIRRFHDVIRGKAEMNKGGEAYIRKINGGESIFFLNTWEETAAR